MAAGPAGGGQPGADRGTGRRGAAASAPVGHEHPGFLNGVSAVSASDAWAVGSGTSEPLILHWNGTTGRR